MRVEMLFDGGRLHVLPLKETSAPTAGNPSVENGFTTAGEITSGTCEITSLETGDVATGSMDIDPDGLSASIDLGSVGPGRVLVQGKLQLASTGTSEMFGGFTHFHLPVASSAGPPQQTALGKFKSAQADEPAPVFFAEDERSASACQCAPACECGSDCRCVAVALADEAGAAAGDTDAAFERRVGNRAEALRRFLNRRATLSVLIGKTQQARKLRAAAADNNLIASLVDDGGVVLTDGSEARIPWPKGADGTFVDQVIKLLQWLIDQADEILAIVMKIIPPGWADTQMALAC